MNISLLCETSSTGCKLHVSELPGCYTAAATCKEAMAILPIEVRLYCAWCGLPTNEALWMSFKEDVKSEAPALFDCEATELEPKAYELLKALAIRTAEDVYTMKAALENTSFSSDSFDKETASIFAAFGFTPKYQDNVQNIKDFFLHLETCGTALSGIVACENEKWTASKAVRRLIMNFRLLAKAIFVAKKDEVLPDPFFLGDDKLNFNVVTFV